MSATEEAPRRPTPAELVAQVALGLHRAGAPEYECNLTLNAKGDVQIYVGGKSQSLDVAEAIAERFDALCARYPRKNGGGEAA